MISKKTFAVVSMVAAALVAACGGGAGNSGSGAGNSGSGAGTGAGNSGSGAGTSGGNYTCCINDAHYRCPDKAAFDKCAGFDIDACMQGCAPEDFSCSDMCFQQWMNSNNDPSGCTEDASVQCSSSSGSGSSSGGPITGSCVGDWDGTMCDEDFNCQSSNCVDNKCYDTADGNPCEEDFNCDHKNCYQGCCYGNAAGDPCEEDFNCDSNNCYNNVCQ